MDPDSSTGNDNSESGECDSLNDENSNLSRQSPKSDRTNIDALDDSARDTIILPPTTDDSSNSIKSMKKSATIRVDLSGDHELLDFGDDGEIVGENDKSDEDDEGDGELEDDGELDDMDDGDEDKPIDSSLLEEGEVATEVKDADEELEEGEVTDDEERQKDKPICRFFSKGQCTWGTNCRFLHPGVTDKGLYTMFDPMRPLLPLPVNPVFAPKPGLLGIAPPNFPPLLAKEEPVIESAWERGLRHAKEIIKQSVKRKETDVDFEEKKMNLSLAQEELDKENDYYVRKPSTPEPEPAADDFDDFEGLDWPPPPAQNMQTENEGRLKIDPDFVRERVHRIGKSSRGIREAPPRDGPSMIREAPPLHEPEVRMVRESALRRTRFDSFNSNKGGSRRSYDDPRKAEEWHDPWMRSKSPGGAGGRTSRKDSSLSKRSSYSSGSSKSSSRSSTSSKTSRSSSSNSSKSSRGSRKSGGGKGKRKELRKAPPRKFSPKPVRIAPPPPPKEEFGRRNFGPPHFDRPTRYAPPPPTTAPVPKKAIPEKDPPKGFLRERDINKRMRRRSRSWSASSSASRSRSRSRSFTPWSRSRSKSASKSRSRSPSSKPRVRSKFSRERSRSRSLSRRISSKSRSSSSSSSSSASFKKASAARKRKRSDKSQDLDGSIPAPVEKQSKLDVPPKTKPLQKGQIKMTLKSSGGIKANRNVLERLSDDFRIDHVVDGNDSNSIKEISPPMLNEDISKSPFEDPSSLSPKESKNTKVRREELLKQLKAVEEAIAKKRSKLDKT